MCDEILQMTPKEAYELGYTHGTMRENKSGWVPCSEREPDMSDLPILCDGESAKGMLVTVFSKTFNARITMMARRVRIVDKKRNVRYEWRHISSKNQIQTDVLAWMEKPEPWDGELTDDSNKVENWPEWKQRAALSNYQFDSANTTN